MIVRTALPTRPDHRWSRVATTVEAAEWAAMVVPELQAAYPGWVITVTTLTEREARHVRGPDGALAYPRVPVPERRCLCCQLPLSTEVRRGPRSRYCDDTCRDHAAATRVHNRTAGIVEMRREEAENAR